MDKMFKMFWSVSEEGRKEIISGMNEADRAAFMQMACAWRMMHDTEYYNTVMNATREAYMNAIQ